MYISTNYGITGSWEFRNSGIKQQINSGRIEGEIFSSFSKHSEDFGQTFITHTCNGYFGNRKDIDLDPLFDNIGYVVSYDPNILDTVYLFVSDDKFENLQVAKKFNFIQNEKIELTRGTVSGELYLFNHSQEFLLLSIDFANTWTKLNNFNFGEFYEQGIVGGRLDGDVYIIINYVSMAWQNANTYILYSNDYGISYELFHPFSKGQEPLLANFSAKTIENENITLTDYDSCYFVSGEIPLDVQFYNYSIGNISSFEWDFDNDGVIDSFEQSPVYTYVDTGWYSVNLTIYNEFDTNSFIREDYIYVDKATGIVNNKRPEIKCYPNPFSSYITFELSESKKEKRIFIYNISGTKIRTLIVSDRTNKISWDGKNSHGIKCNPGVYFVKINDNSFYNKLLLTN